MGKTENGKSSIAQRTQRNRLSLWGVASGAFLLAALLFALPHGGWPEQKSGIAFAAERFSFDKFQTSEEFAQALRQQFPEGTAKSVVEKALVTEAGAAKENDESRPNVFHYQRRRTPPNGPDDQWAVAVMYYSNDTVRQIRVTGYSWPIRTHELPVDRSDAQVFLFEDYSDAQSLIETLRLIFPLDTKKSTVERVLVKWNQARILRDDGRPQQVTYQKEFPVPKHVNKDQHSIEHYVWTVKVDYLKTGVVQQISVSGSPIISAFKLSRQYFLDHKSIKNKHKEGK